MPRFRRKPTEIEAVQFVLGEDEAAVPGVCRCMSDECGSWPHVHTMHANQAVRLESGDWVVPEPDGEHYYPIKDSVFAATYEPAGAPRVDDALPLRLDIRDLLLVGRDVQRLLADWRDPGPGETLVNLDAYEIAERRQALARLDEALERIGGIT